MYRLIANQSAEFSIFLIQYFGRRKHFIANPFVFFFGNGFVIGIIALVSQIEAEQAILAIFAIIEKRRVGTSDTVLTKVSLIAFCEIERMHAALTFHDKNTIPAIFAFMDRLSVSAILIEPAAKHQVTVLLVRSEITIIGVNVVRCI
ncbi:MAG: hypothetical protein Q7R79_04390 [bacterium]|nr:hypothetical protein [bacterium]